MDIGNVERCCQPQHINLLKSPVTSNVIFLLITFLIVKMQISALAVQVDANFDQNLQHPFVYGILSIKRFRYVAIKRLDNNNCINYEELFKSLSFISWI
jgi:hypothetical protein